MPENANAGRTVARVLPLTLGLLLIAALGVGAVAVQAQGQGAPPEELSEAELLSRVTSAPDNAPAFHATVEVEQTVVPEGLIGASEGDGDGNSGPRTAQIWRGGPDESRVVLQGDNGDKVLVRNGSEVSVYDGATNTMKTGALPEESAGMPEEKAASPEEIDELLAEISPTSDLQVNDPKRVAGRWTYHLTLKPKDEDSTLVERVEAFIDSETFVPLRLALYAEDNSEEPVARYEAQEFEIGPQNDDLFQIEAPPGAQVEALEPRDGDARAEGDLDGNQEPRRVASVAEAQELVDFPVGQLVAAPGSREFTGVRVIGSEGVVQTYGSGWGTVVLAQGPEQEPEGAGETRDEEARDEDRNGRAQVPTVDLGGGVEVKEISTPIGTALSWNVDGVSYSLKGSVPAAELEEAARGLIARQSG